MTTPVSPTNTSTEFDFAQWTASLIHLNRSNGTHPAWAPGNPLGHSSLAPDLFQDPFVRKLYLDVQEGHKDLKNATQALVLNQKELFKVQKAMLKLMEENQKLKLENQILQVEVACFSLSASSSPTLSLSPSNSISQVPTPSHFSFAPSVAVQPTAQPLHLPFEVLWTIDNCHNDPDATPLDSNPSHPPMNLAIQTSNGALISTEKYNNICTDISLLSNSNLHQLLTPLVDPMQHCKSIHIVDGIEMRSISWYKSCYPHVLQWNPKKADLINAILASTHIPSDDAICLIVNKQKGKKGAPVL
ncbi:hypothetical protein BDZ94DRAFT_1353485 [Collybia nuda]|uniref:Uncharacterized protein n=1 Tax=Collybia nuda TaxID=64659 RepID=A0A9P5Y997_9AGAR|nr:hypothetical protein BDZ94DRAFT_1353485 [Collybia nuda]